MREFLGEGALATLRVELRDSYDGHRRGRRDRSTGSCSTCPSRGRSIPHAESALHAGGILVAYTPSITQAAQARAELKGRWIDARTLEVLHRTWHIDGQSVRPDHRMVAHTGLPHRRPASSGRARRRVNGQASVDAGAPAEVAGTVERQGSM